MSRILILAFLLPMGVLAAQSYPNDGVTQSAWFAYVGDHTFAKRPDEGKWGLHLESQLRRSPFVANSQQLLLRPGLFRKVAESQRITVGYTYVRNSPPANSATILGVEPRHTAYTQYDRDDKLGRIKLKQSARLENTFAGSRREHIDIRYSFRQVFATGWKRRLKPSRRTGHCQTSTRPTTRSRSASLQRMSSPY